MNLKTLPNELKFLIEKYTAAGLEITTPPIPETENSDYRAYRFGLNNYNIVFRVAKTTPTKIGQFVTLWKRPRPHDEIAPLDTTDNIDFVIVNVSDGIHSGQFIFNTKILAVKDIFSRDSKGEKRAFRLYPPWTNPSSPQALKTQKWQLPYFLSFNGNEHLNAEQMRKLFEKND